MQLFQNIGDDDIVRIYVSLLVCITLNVCCKVDGQSTAYNSDRLNTAMTTSQSNSARADVVSQQLQEITDLLVRNIKGVVGKIAAQQQELVHDIEQIKQQSNRHQQELVRDIQQIKENLATQKQIIDNTELINRTQPRDCYDIMSVGVNASGVYTVFIGRNDKIHPVSVYCDMETADGGWTVIQRRKDGSEYFYRNWNQYADGFGSLLDEFWLGNDNLFALTRNKRYKLRFDLADFEGNGRYAEYADFKVGSECDKFKLLSLGTYSGDAGDSLTRHVGSKFSTHDQDNDSCSGDAHCSVLYKGGWWYDCCHESNPNGIYYRGTHTTYADGINWRHWKGYHYSLRFTEMKVRPT